jgi:hypothetical protein
MTFVIFYAKQHLHINIVNNIHKSIYETKVVCFVLSCWDLSNHGALFYVVIFGKLLMSTGVLTSFQTVYSYGVEAIDY